MDQNSRSGTLLSDFQSHFPPSAQLQPKGRPLPYTMEPGFYELGKVWMYGNVKLRFSRLAFVEIALGSPPFSNSQLLDIEREAERLVIEGFCLVSGIHNAAHQRAALVPLKWGAPRILIFSGGIRYHLGNELTEEPFRMARLWRYEWDPNTDLAISRRKPESLPTYSHHNPTIDRMVRELAEGTLEGFNSPLLAFGRR